MMPQRVMISRSRYFLAAVVLLMTAAMVVLGSGCGGSSPAVNTAPQKTFPESEYLVATGVSAESHEDAEQRARNAVAAQVRSSLESQTETQVSSVHDGQQETYLSSTSLQLRQNVSFSHGELIHIDLESRREKDGLYHAVAYLRRSEAARVLHQDYKAASANLARAHGGVQDVDADDLPGFAAAYGEARSHFLVANQRVMELRAVTGSRPAQFDQDINLWNDLQNHRQERLDDLRLSFVLLPVIPAGDKLDMAHLHQEFIQSLTDLGMTVRGDECGDGEYLLEFQPRLHYQGVIGVVCRLDFAGTLTECSTGDTWDLLLEDADFVGEGANAFTARHLAEDKVTQDSLAPLLIDALGANLPVH